MVKIYRVIQIKLNRITFPYGPCSRAVKMNNVDRVCEHGPCSCLVWIEHPCCRTVNTGKVCGPLEHLVLKTVPLQGRVEIGGKGY